jgi:hypothetical protein
MIQLSPIECYHDATIDAITARRTKSQGAWHRYQRSRLTQRFWPLAIFVWDAATLVSRHGSPRD